MKIHDSILDCVGKTPLVQLNRMGANSKGRIVAKLESANPGGSVKDRIAIHMVDRAEREGTLKPGGTIIECTSGNTGLGLAILATVRGYNAIFTMPDKVAAEKSKLLKAFGAEVILAPTSVAPDDPRSYYSIAKRLSTEIENSFYPNQYDNPDNPEAHYLSTGPEIWEDTDGKITHFVAGMGTGGTISGVGRYLKEKNPEVRIIGADPVGSLYTEYFKTGKLGEAHTYLIEGIGEDILPTTMHFDVIDEVIQVTDFDAFRMARRMAREEALFSGSSAGCAMHAAIQVAATLKEGDLMVILIPDTGERYLSKVYDEEWLRENQLLDGGIDLSVGFIIRRKQEDIPQFVAVDASNSVSDGIALLREHNISQLPVLDGDKVVGSLPEGLAIQLLLEGGSAVDQPVRDVMGAAFPEVDENVSAEEIVDVFSKGIPAVIVVSKDGQRGILTKWDVLHSVRAKRR